MNNNKKCNKCEREIYFVQKPSLSGEMKWYPFDTLGGQPHYKACGVIPQFKRDDYIMTNWKPDITSFFFIRNINTDNMTYEVMSDDLKNPIIKIYDIITIDRFSIKTNEATKILYK